jgi:hypothetical protein
MTKVRIKYAGNVFGRGLLRLERWMLCFRSIVPIIIVQVESVGFDVHLAHTRRES